MFDLYPAIDLKGGQVVRLRRGDMADATIYGPDPAEQARVFQTLGFAWLHVVDLDGAFAGQPANSAAVQRIVASTTASIQLGGGIRSMAVAEFWLSTGVARIILGSIAVKNPALVKEACRAFPGRVVLGIDAKDGMVATEGWAEVTDIPTLDLARRFEDAGAAAIIFTDINRDGMLGGSNVVATRDLAEGVSLPVIASGGVSSVLDILALREASPLISGAIIGRAFYEGVLDGSAALQAASVAI